MFLWFHYWFVHGQFFSLWLFLWGSSCSSLLCLLPLADVSLQTSPMMQPTMNHWFPPPLSHVSYSESVRPSLLGGDNPASLPGTLEIGSQYWWQFHSWKDTIWHGEGCTYKHWHCLLQRFCSSFIILRWMCQNDAKDKNLLVLRIILQILKQPWNQWSS